MNLSNLPLLKARFGNNRNMDDLIDTLAAINKPPLSMIQSQIPLSSTAKVISVAHGLGGVPSKYRVGIQVLPSYSDLYWNAGTIIDQSQIWTPSGSPTVYIPVISSAVDATNIYIIQGAVPTSNFYIFNNASIPVLTVIDNILAWAYTVYASLDYIVTQTTNPQIITQPANTAVTAPAATSFTVVASGSGTLSYQWNVSINSGVTWSVASGGVYSGGTTSQLSISNSTGLNGYQYQCVVTSSITSNSVASAAATLTVS